MTNGEDLGHATGKELLSLKGHAGRVKSVAFSPDGQRLASAELGPDGEDLGHATGKELFSLKGHAGVSERGVQPRRPAPGFGERDGR